MLQEITTYIILAISFGIFFYKLFHFFDVFKENNTKSACASCTAGSCGGCALADLKKPQKPY
ncbi:MAG: hypothetical protein B7C24_00875 [Bacteroidetes bacterium 4572_77]|nr:MAG: hypothetical protein B7C24_00875 [Bacteroidetes bacterium 4572_77]